MVQMVEEAFIDCKVLEDIWKIDLCYFVNGFLFESELSSTFQREMLGLVENEDFFFKLPWGR